MKKIKCILLIDDNPADNEFHEIIIRHADVCEEIKVVYDGVKALEYLKKSGEDGQSEHYPLPDVIFLDINMPRMNGFEFLDEYKNLELKQKSKVVIMMLTTSLNPDDEKRAKTYDTIDGFLNKPLTHTMLTSLLEKHFKKES